jgi:hypothetical protein
MDTVAAFAFLRAVPFFFPHIINLSLPLHIQFIILNKIEKTIQQHQAPGLLLGIGRKTIFLGASIKESKKEKSRR